MTHLPQALALHPTPKAGCPLCLFAVVPQTNIDIEQAHMQLFDLRETGFWARAPVFNSRLGGEPNRKWVGFCIENSCAEWKKVLVVEKEK